MTGRRPYIYLIICALLICVEGQLHAQQKPVFSQYMVDKFLVNPAFAGRATLRSWAGQPCLRGPTIEASGVELDEGGSMPSTSRSIRLAVALIIAALTLGALPSLASAAQADIWA